MFVKRDSTAELVSCQTYEPSGLNRGLFWPFTGPRRYVPGVLASRAGTGQGGLSPRGDEPDGGGYRIRIRLLESIESPRPFALSPSTLVRCADGVTVYQRAGGGQGPRAEDGVDGFRTDALHAGQDSYSPVSLVYFDRAQFKFSGPLTTGHQGPGRAAHAVAPRDRHRTERSSKRPASPSRRAWTGRPRRPSRA